MTAAISTARWRDQPIAPKDYEDIASLVKVAREARDHIIEFDWWFTRDDLQRLRLAVYTWGKSVTGRYKCFDARVLAAINHALGETDSAFVLNEPKSSHGMVCAASCVADGDGFRLRGHAPFDIMFGYGSAGIGQSQTGSVHLGPTAQETLAGAVGMLSWDLRRLQEDRFRPVRNALYGLPLASGVVEGQFHLGPAKDVPVDFQGPFSAVDNGACRCLFGDQIANRTGVYLWTINVGGEDRVWYVGQTRVGFGTRMAQHLRGMLSGEYPTYDVAALLRGEYRLAAGAVAGRWPETLPSVLRNFETLVPNIVGLIRLTKFHLAPLAGDAHLHNRVEGMIGRYYQSHRNPQLRVFPAGVKLPAAVPFDTPIRLVLSSEAPVAGLPAELPE